MLIFLYLFVYVKNYLYYLVIMNKKNEKNKKFFFLNALKYHKYAGINPDINNFYLFSIKVKTKYDN